MHGLPTKYAHVRIEAVLNLVDLQAVKHRKLGCYSRDAAALGAGASHDP